MIFFNFNFFFNKKIFFFWNKLDLNIFNKKHFEIMIFFHYNFF